MTNDNDKAGLAPGHSQAGPHPLGGSPDVPVGRGADMTTGLIHHPYQPPDTWDAVPPGVFKASTVIFPDVASLRARVYTAKTGYTYGLRGTPGAAGAGRRVAVAEQRLLPVQRHGRERAVALGHRAPVL